MTDKIMSKFIDCSKNLYIQVFDVITCEIDDKNALLKMSDLIWRIKCSKMTPELKCAYRAGYII